MLFSKASLVEHICLVRLLENDVSLRIFSIWKGCMDQITGLLDVRVGLKKLAACRMNLRPVMHNEVVCQVDTLMTLLNGSLAKAVAANEILKDPHYEKIFLYCTAWSLGALLEPKDRILFDAELRSLSDAVPPKVSLPRWPLHFMP